MSLFWFLLQTPSPDGGLTDEFVETIGNTVTTLGRATQQEQLSTIISLFIGVILVIFVYEIRSWHRQQQTEGIRQEETNGLRDEIKDLKDDKDKLEEQFETERTKRHGVEDELATIKRQYDDCQHDLKEVDELQKHNAELLTEVNELKAKKSGDE